MNVDALEMLTFSGVRPGEDSAVIGILEQCGLPFQDITLLMLKDFLVARKDGDIVGVIGLEICRGDALMRSLAVTDVNRRMGIGLKLVQSVEQYARVRRVETLYLLTTAAEGFFRNAGYAAVERQTAPDALQATREFQTLCPDIAVCMRKEIGL